MIVSSPKKTTLYPEDTDRNDKTAVRLRYVATPYTTATHGREKENASIRQDSGGAQETRRAIPGNPKLLSNRSFHPWRLDHRFGYSKYLGSGKTP